MTLPSESPVCPACGLVLPLGLPAGVCPRCLLGAGLVATGVAEAATEVSGEGAGSGTTELTEGAVIDRYRIGRRIGRGGMGEVYAAEQVEPVKRQVAFKVIKRGMDTDHIISRFQTERQALALMDHPNIAVVLDAGATPAGRPYFVMEFVQGVPLTAFCTEKNLPLRARIDLFLAVCGALQHAHQKGIIHRDLKPSNILVSVEAGQPVPKVIDFGLAKATGQDATDRTLLTEAGQVLGTPAYMSPEQAGGTKDLDTRADVYALGAVLYELITGDPPFDRRRLESAAWEEILRLIREEEPPRPSARLAISHKHGGQHGTTDHGTTGLRTRALSNTHGDDRGKEHREKHGVPALAGSGAAREGGSPNTASRGPAKAGTPNIRATPSNGPTPSKGATRSKGGTRSIPADLDWIVMKALEKDRARRYDTVSGLAGDVRHFLAHEPVAARPPTAAYRLGKFVRRHRRSLATAAVLTAGILSTAGVWAKAEWEKRQRIAAVSQQVLGLVAEAERLMQENDRVDYDNHEPFLRALELGERARALLGTGTPDGGVAARLNTLLAAVGQEREARDLIWELEEVSIASFSDEDTKESLSLYSAVLTNRGIEPGRSAIEPIAGRFFSHREAVRSRLAAELERWADLVPQGVIPEQPVRDWLQQLVSTIDPDDVWRNQLRSAARTRDPDACARLAVSAERHHQPASVMVQLAESLNGVEGHILSTSLLKKLTQNHPANFWAHLALGTTMAEALNSADPRLPAEVGGKRTSLTVHFLTPREQPPRRREYDEAIGHLGAAVALRPRSAGAWLNLGHTLLSAGRIDEAIAAQRKAIELNPDRAVAYVNLGIALFGKGEPDGEIAAARKAIELEPDLAVAHMNLVSALLAKGDAKGAIEEGRKAIGLKPDWAVAHLNLSLALKDNGEFDGAIAEARKAIELMPDLAEAHINLSLSLKGKGDTAGARRAAGKAVELKPDLAEAHMCLGEALGDEDTAIAAFRKAVELNPGRRLAHSKLAKALVEKGELDGAIAAARRAIELKPGLAAAHYDLGVTLLAKGNSDEAIVAYRKAIELNPDHVHAHVNLGGALLAKHNLDEAMAETRRAIELEPGSAMAHSNLSHALQAKGELDAAIAAARKAIQLSPDLAEGHANLGGALAKTGDLDGAIPCFRKAIEVNPNLAMVHHNLGMAHYLGGEVAGAIPAWLEAIRLNPNFAEAHYSLGLGLLYSGSFAAALHAFERALASEPGGTVAEMGTRTAGVARTLVQQEAALIGRMRGSFRRRNPPNRAGNEAALDDMYGKVSPFPQPSRSALRDYGESNRAKLVTALGRATLQMITVPKGLSGAADGTRQRRLAADVRRKAAGGADFGELASAYSTDSFAREGGRREITRMSLKKLLSDAAFALQPGEISPVIEDEGNFYLIRMVERQAADAKAINLDDPEVKSAVAAMIEADRREAWKEKFWRQCVEKARGK